MKPTSKIDTLPENEERHVPFRNIEDEELMGIWGGVTIREYIADAFEKITNIIAGK